MCPSAFLLMPCPDLWVDVCAGQGWLSGVQPSPLGICSHLWEAHSAEELEAAYKLGKNLATSQSDLSHPQGC